MYPLSVFRAWQSCLCVRIEIGFVLQMTLSADAIVSGLLHAQFGRASFRFPLADVLFSALPSLNSLIILASSAAGACAGARRDRLRFRR